MKGSLDFLCCPLCHSNLTLNADRVVDDQIISGSLKCQACNKKYSIEDGIPNFLSAELLDEKDEKWMLQYDAMAGSYDILMCLLIPLFTVGLEPFERFRWVKRLRIEKGAQVLDVSTGTGKNLPFLRRQIGSSGRLVAMDISRGMLAYAKMKIEKKGWENVELHRANSSYLPYKNEKFDAVMHVGGINTFGEKKRALSEMVRVAKKNAEIIIVDEGLAPNKERTFLGKFLLRTNSLYACKPPTKLLPRNIKRLQVTWKNPLYWPHYIMELQKA